MPLMPGKGRDVVSGNISEMMHAGYPQKQAVAASLSNARRHPRRAEGGGIVDGGADELETPGAPVSDPFSPLPTAKPVTGLLHSAVAGRTDHLDVKVPAGAYVIPADVVSGTGEGNTLAGARILQKVIESGPHGTGLGRHHPHRGRSIPQPPPAARAAGGGVDQEHEMVPILGAGGEMVVHPDHVAMWGGGNVERGHRVFDKWVVEQRKNIVKEMQKLPGPVKD